VTPLADAVRFVDCQQRDTGFSQSLRSSSRVESLRRNVKELDLAAIDAGEPI